MEQSGFSPSPERLESLGGAFLRYGIAIILLYFGAFKFTAVEAAGIQPLVSNSPFMGWLYRILSVQGVSNLIGVTEIVTAVLLCLRPWSAKAAFWGSLLAIGTFAATLSFLITTPKVWGYAPGFPLPLPRAEGGFLLKDWFLLGGAFWSAGEAWRATKKPVPA